ncbi:hypothetical protein N8947_01615 [Candidatus Pelagibacter sp.]|nr:hypothetical protein [Candidatus Pelagibacter sp.]
MKRLLVYLFIILGLGLTFNIYADNHSNDLKKINEQLNSVKKLFDTGVLDEEGYRSAKNRLDEKKKIILSKNKKNKKKSITSTSKTLEKQIEVLENLLKDGVLSEEEFLKTKKYLIDKEKDGSNISLNNEVKIPSTYVLNVKKVPGRKSWEKAEMIFEDYRIITYRPGGIKVVRLSDGKKLLHIVDNYKIKFFNNGEDVLSIKKTEYQVDRTLTGMTEGLDSHIENTVKEITEILKDPFKKRKKVTFDTKTHKLELFINNKRALHYVGRYVKRHRAFFYQVLTDKSEPFHFYIKIDARASIALNMEYFNAKIDRAVRKAKKRLSLEFDVTEEEIEKIIEEKVGEETNKAIEDSMEKAINESVVEAIKQSIGEVLSATLVNAIEEATGEAIEESIEAELANAINEEIANAVAQGIDEAAVTAGWEAYFEVLAAGGTAEEASAKAYETCGSACDNY